uniref:rho GTPase-activating protein 18-like n=1 Tax=Myxine glutinosa TaxID=7769 RepID=UPI00358DE55A
MSSQESGLKHATSHGSLDELNVSEFWDEVNAITESCQGIAVEDAGIVCPADDEEEQERWLEETGLSILISDSEEGLGDAKALLSTLSRAQTDTVRRRINTYHQTMRKKNKQHVRDVRDIFDTPENDGSDCFGTEVQPISEDHKNEQETQPGEMRDVGVSLDVSLTEESFCSDVPFSEDAANRKHRDDNQRRQRLAGRRGMLGCTRLGLLSAQDMKKVHRLILIELTAIFDSLGIEFVSGKPGRARQRDSRIFGVPLSTLLEHDQKISQKVKIPLFLQDLITHLEVTSLDTEGIFRISGSTSRVKSLRQEAETKFYDSGLEWDGIQAHDAASLLKLFLRELPHPLLTAEYLHAFTSLEYIKCQRHKLQALNLLIILLPEANRDVLKALLELLAKVVEHEDQTRMGLRNVAVVMAPNIFMPTSSVILPRKTCDAHTVPGYVGLMHLLLKHQDILWTVPWFILHQLRKLNDMTNKRPHLKERGMRMFLKLARLDKEKKGDKKIEGLPYLIRVHAPKFNKVSTMIQLDECLLVGDVITRCLQDSDLNQKRLYCLHEVGGNIGDRCLHKEMNMKAIYEENPNAEWIIKPGH